MRKDNMDTKWKYLLLSLLVCGLVTCSQDDEDTSADNETGTTPASTPANTGNGTAPTSPSPSTSAPVLPPTSDTSGDVPQVECNVWAQTGCDSGQKCAFVVDGVNPQDNTNILGHVACVKDGTAGLGKACESAFDIEVDPPVVNVGESDTCQGASVCYKNTCRSLCSDVNPVCSDGGTCVSFALYGDAFQVCLASCNLLEQDCEEEGFACYPTLNGNLCGYPRVPEGETGRTGTPCEYINNCVGGYLCSSPPGAQEGDPGVCTQICDASPLCFDEESALPIACGCGDTNPCGPAEICRRYVDEADVSLGYGGCAEAASLDGCDCNSDPICIVPEENE